MIFVKEQSGNALRGDQYDGYKNRSVGTHGAGQSALRFLHQEIPSRELVVRQRLDSRPGDVLAPYPAGERADQAGDGPEDDGFADIGAQ